MVYPYFRWILFPLCRLFISKIAGLGNIPKKGNFILIANHGKRMDPVFLFYVIVRFLNRKVCFIATPHLWFLGEAICRRWAGCIPLFNPGQAFQDAKEALLSGEIVGIFPEGDYHFKERAIKTGAFRLAYETKTPILPASISFSKAPFSGEIHIGKPFTIKSRTDIRQVAKQAMDAVYALKQMKL
ncbi:1-acyl-sn-glycerol-3-phosphate acyltransferase [Candidatus Woesearchaeota archaeon]|nr:1-acyl-sn-glycerol-3-phosphate acyltransferase [Candidatus Woesearchaeota archaeon]